MIQFLLPSYLLPPTPFFLTLLCSAAAGRLEKPVKRRESSYRIAENEQGKSGSQSESRKFSLRAPSRASASVRPSVRHFHLQLMFSSSTPTLRAAAKSPADSSGLCDPAGAHRLCLPLMRGLIPTSLTPSFCPRTPARQK